MGNFASIEWGIERRIAIVVVVERLAAADYPRGHNVTTWPYRSARDSSDWRRLQRISQRQDPCETNACLVHEESEEEHGKDMAGVVFEHDDDDVVVVVVVVVLIKIRRRRDMTAFFGLAPDLTPCKPSETCFPRQWKVPETGIRA
eukprot:761546-Hanusia_phi.AAC.2